MPATLPPLVSADALAAALADPDHGPLVVLDATTRLELHGEGEPYTATPALDGYLTAHVPGAVFADVPNVLSDPAGRFPFTLPGPERFAEAAGGLGIGEDTHVVVYDTASSAWATRVWWLLRVFGHDAVSVLDGGLRGWTSARLAVESGTVVPTPATFTARLRPELVADTDEVRALSEAGGLLVNTLDPATFRGESARSPYRRRGRIPGSTNLPSATLTDPDTGRFLEPSALREALGSAGLLRGDRGVTYCGGGIAATVPAFAAYTVDGTELAVYDGSLSAWTADVELPLDVG